MASIFKPTYSKADPQTGRRTMRKSRKWYVQYRDAGGIVRRVPGYTDKEATRALATKLEKQAGRRREGFTDALDDQLARPMAEHVADYEIHLKSDGVSERYRYDAMRRLTTIINRCGFRRMAEVAAPTVEQFLAEILTRGRGPSTRNSYLEAVRTFVSWAMRTKPQRIGLDPLTSIERLNEDVDVRRQRRAMTEDEMAKLLRVAAERPLLERPTYPGQKKLDDAGYVRLGRERALIYKTLILTGLRRGELATLTVGNLKLDSEPFTATVQARYAKNRRTEDVPLRIDLAADLRKWLADDGESDRAATVFDVPYDLVSILKRDLTTAGICYRDEDGRYLDVHAMRHTTATYLAKAGVAPRVAQQVMRHSDLELTMKVYTDARLLDLAGAVAQLPDIPLDGNTSNTIEAESVTLQATGTDGDLLQTSEPLALRLALTSEIASVRMSSDETPAEPTATREACGKSLTPQRVENDCDALIAIDRGASRSGQKYPRQESNL